MTEWVVHCIKKRYPLYDVYIGRHSRWICKDIPGADGFWGNPFGVEKDENGNEIPGSREQIIRLHKDWLLSDEVVWFNKPLRSNKQVMGKLPELKGKVLGCYCRPAKACHGDILSTMANNLVNTKK